MAATPDLPYYCFDVIIAKLKKHPLPKLKTSSDEDKYPLFVTWKKGPRHELRGCIGTFSHDEPIPRLLQEYAQTSAFRDNRFRPISIEEVPTLTCGVSLLVHFEPARDYLDWTIGVHGIRIDFNYRGRRHSAVFLPEVASEQGWNHVQTIDHLLHKGGFEGRVQEDDRLACRVERFQSSKVTLSYADYLAMKANKS